jgi:hypothetical protein
MYVIWLLYSEYAILSDKPIKRTASIRARTFVDLLSLSKGDFDDVWRMYPSLYQKIVQKAKDQWQNAMTAVQEKEAREAELAAEQARAAGLDPNHIIDNEVKELQPPIEGEGDEFNEDALLGEGDGTSSGYGHSSGSHHSSGEPSEPASFGDDETIAVAEEEPQVPGDDMILGDNDSRRPSNVAIPAGMMVGNDNDIERKGSVPDALGDGKEEKNAGSSAAAAAAAANVISPRDGTGRSPPHATATIASPPVGGGVNGNNPRTTPPSRVRHLGGTGVIRDSSDIPFDGGDLLATNSESSTMDTANAERVNAIAAATMAKHGSSPPGTSSLFAAAVVVRGNRVAPLPPPSSIRSPPSGNGRNKQRIDASVAEAKKRAAAEAKAIADDEDDTVNDADIDEELAMDPNNLTALTAAFAATSSDGPTKSNTTNETDTEAERVPAEPPFERALLRRDSSRRQRIALGPLNAMTHTDSVKDLGSVIEEISGQFSPDPILGGVRPSTSGSQSGHHKQSMSLVAVKRRSSGSRSRSESKGGPSPHGVGGGGTSPATSSTHRRGVSFAAALAAARRQSEAVSPVLPVSAINLVPPSPLAVPSAIGSFPLHKDGSPSPTNGGVAMRLSSRASPPPSSPTHLTPGSSSSMMGSSPRSTPVSLTIAPSPLAPRASISSSSPSSSSASAVAATLVPSSSIATAATVIAIQSNVFVPSNNIPSPTPSSSGARTLPSNTSSILSHGSPRSGPQRHAHFPALEPLNIATTGSIASPPILSPSLSSSSTSANANASGAPTSLRGGHAFPPGSPLSPLPLTGPGSPKINPRSSMPRVTPPIMALLREAANTEAAAAAAAQAPSNTINGPPPATSTSPTGLSVSTSMDSFQPPTVTRASSSVLTSSTSSEGKRSLADRRAILMRAATMSNPSAANAAAAKPNLARVAIAALASSPNGRSKPLSPPLDTGSPLSPGGGPGELNRRASMAARLPLQRGMTSGNLNAPLGAQPRRSVAAQHMEKELMSLSFFAQPKRGSGVFGKNAAHLSPNPNRQSWEPGTAKRLAGLFNNNPNAASPAIGPAHGHLAPLSPAVGPLNTPSNGMTSLGALPSTPVMSFTPTSSSIPHSQSSHAIVHHHHHHSPHPLASHAGGISPMGNQNGAPITPTSVSSSSNGSSVGANSLVHSPEFWQRMQSMMRAHTLPLETGYQGVVNQHSALERRYQHLEKTVHAFIEAVKQLPLPAGVQLSLATSIANSAATQSPKFGPHPSSSTTTNNGTIVSVSSASPPPMNLRNPIPSSPSGHHRLPSGSSNAAVSARGRRPTVMSSTTTIPPPAGTVVSSSSSDSITAAAAAVAAATSSTGPHMRTLSSRTSNDGISTPSTPVQHERSIWPPPLSSSHGNPNSNSNTVIPPLGIRSGSPIRHGSPARTGSPRLVPLVAPSSLMMVSSAPLAPFADLSPSAPASILPFSVSAGAPPHNVAPLITGAAWSSSATGAITGGIGSRPAFTVHSTLPTTTPSQSSTPTALPSQVSPPPPLSTSSLHRPTISLSTIPTVTGPPPPLHTPTHSSSGSISSVNGLLSAPGTGGALHSPPSPRVRLHPLASSPNRGQAHGKSFSFGASLSHSLPHGVSGTLPPPSVHPEDITSIDALTLHRGHIRSTSSSLHVRAASDLSAVGGSPSPTSASGASVANRHLALPPS